MDTSQILAICGIVGGVISPIVAYWAKTVSSKVDNLMTKVAKLEANQVDAEKVRAIVDSSVDRALSPASRRLERIEHTLDEVRMGVASYMAKRRREDDGKPKA